MQNKIAVIFYLSLIQIVNRKEGATKYALFKGGARNGWERAEKSNLDNRLMRAICVRRCPLRKTITMPEKQL